MMTGGSVGTNQHDYPPGLRLVTDRNTRLRQLVFSEGIVVAPGAFDVITARLVEIAGFPVVYMTGSGVSMSALGAPDVGLLSFAEVLDRARRMCDVLSIPLIADADTGYGGPLNVIRTVREFERAGVSAMQIEDQTWPKKCGHEMGRRLLDTQEMVNNIKAAVDSRTDEDFLIIARTDARTTQGINAALERGEAYREAGADVVFVESPETEGEMRLINDAIDAPTLANMVEGGRTPFLPVARLEELGYQLVIYPNSLTRMIAKMGQVFLQELRETGTTTGMADSMLTHRELWSLFEYAQWVATEERFQ